MVSEKSKIPVIVTLSGKLDIDADAELTAEQIFDMIEEKWGIDAGMTRAPFVVVHDQLMSKYRTIEGKESIGKIDGMREVVRVVMPLKE